MSKHFESAELFSRIGRYDLAYKALKIVGASNLDEQDRVAQILFGLQCGGVRLAWADYTELLKAGANTAKLSYVMARALSEQALDRAPDGTETTKLLEAALREDPTFYPAKIGLAFLLGLKGDFNHLTQTQSLIEELPIEDLEEQLTQDELRLLSICFRMVGDSKKSASFGAMAVQKSSADASTKRFLSIIEKLKGLPSILGEQREAKISVEKFEADLAELSKCALPASASKSSVLESLLEANNFYLPYLTNLDKELSNGFYNVIRGLNFDLFDGARIPTRKLCVLSNFKYHNEVFIFNFLKEILSDPTWEVDFVNIGERGVLRSFAGFIPNPDRAFDIPLSARNFDGFVGHLRAKKYGAVFFPEVGMSAMSRFVSFHRFAPIQFTSWMHPTTTGSPQVDLFFSGKEMEPLSAESAYTEEVVFLPGVGQQFGLTQPSVLPNRADVKFGRVVCIQSAFKIQPYFDEWLDLIADFPSVDEIVLINPIQPHHSRVMRSRMQKLRNNGKISFVPRMQRTELAAFLSKSGVALDLPNWSGGNTTVDCFKQCLPVIAFEGEVMRARHTLGMYRIMGLEEQLVAKDQAAYLRLVEVLTRDPTLNSSLRFEIAKKIPRLYESGFESQRALRHHLNSLIPS